MIREKILEKQYKENVLKKYYKTVGVNSPMARSLIKKLNYRQDPYLLRCIALTYFDESRLNDDDTYKRFFNIRKLRLAEKYIIRAYTLNEDCIDVLYTLGETRNGFKQTNLAIYCFERIIELGRKKLSNKDTCTDSSLVQAKVNDSRFQLYRLYHDKGDFKLAKKYLSNYKRGLKKGIKTIFNPLEKYLMD